MPHSLLKAGNLIDDRWRLERQLSEGATSCVWEAENTRLEGRVAIKFGLASALSSSTMHERFLRESQAMCKIRSPHVVQVSDRGVTHGLPYLVMELLEGEDLGVLLAREKTLSLSEASSMLDQLSRGLAKVHSAGFVHRDIKPENVFVIHEGDGGHFVKLLDFGIVKQLTAQQTALTQPDMVVGTAHYLSPEQIERPLDIDHRADVWALGVLAYRMLFGTLTFDGDSWSTLCARILAAEYTQPSTLRPGIPAEIDAWFEHMLARDRGRRFDTVSAASAALSSIARRHASGVLARPMPAESAEHPAPARAQTAARRRPFALSMRPLLASAFVLALAVLAAAFFGRGGRHPRSAKPATQLHLSARPAPTPAATAAPAPQAVPAASPVTEPVPQPPAAQPVLAVAAEPQHTAANPPPPAAEPKRKPSLPVQVPETLPAIKDRGF